MSVASATATDTLLDYTVTTNPDPIQVSPESGDPSLATLVVVVSNPQSDAVRVQKIELSFDIGDKDDPDATYLTDIGEGIHTRSSSPDWSLPTSADGSFVVTPQGDPEISSQGLTFTLSHIVVNPISAVSAMPSSPSRPVARRSRSPSSRTASGWASSPLRRRTSPTTGRPSSPGAAATTRPIPCSGQTSRTVRT